MRRAALVGALVVCAVAAEPGVVHAQAWPAPAGAGSVTVATQVIDNTGHRLTDGTLLPDGKSRNVSALIDLDYAITDRLAVSVGLPYVFSRYTGPGPPPFIERAVDACRCWNSAWQDINASVRYTLTDGPVALTTSVATGLPSHDYEWQGEAVAGFGLRELRLAVDGGVRLEALSPRLALLGRYQYAIVERVLDVSHNRSNVSASLSVAISERFSVRGGGDWQRTHGGLRFGSTQGSLIVPGEFTTDALFDQHDRLLRDNNVRVGGGLSYSLPRVDLFMSYMQFVAGTDTHAGHALTFGMSVPFQRH